MFAVKGVFSLVLVFTLTLTTGSSSKLRNSSSIDDRSGNSSDFLRNETGAHSSKQPSKTGLANVITSENIVETKFRSRNRNLHIASHKQEHITAPSISAELFQSTSSDHNRERTSDGQEAEKIDSTARITERSHETITKTRIFNETSTVEAVTKKLDTSPPLKDLSSVGASDPLNVLPKESKSPSRPQTLTVKVSKFASKLSSAKRNIETTAKSTTLATIKSSTMKQQTESSELSFKQGGEVEKSVTDSRGLELRRNKTPEHVTIPCGFTRHGNYYDSSSLIAAAVGGAFVGGALVLAVFYCKQRFYRYLRGDYRRVPMEYDFELNPRLKSP